MYSTIKSINKRLLSIFAMATIAAIMAAPSSMAVAHNHADDSNTHTTAANHSIKFPILSMRDRADAINAMLKDKLDNTLPALMDANNIDMWLLISREYNEDPVLKTMLPSTWLSARRRTILVLYKVPDSNTVERFAVARYQVGEMFDKAWDKEKQPDQWGRLVELIEEKNPKRIGINKSEHFALADGLVATEYELLMKALPDSLEQRIVSAEPLAISWLETRTEMEMKMYPLLVKMGHDIIKELYTSGVVKPGVTTTEDMVWWLRERSRELKLTNWFVPSVSIQRDDRQAFDQVTAFSQKKENNVVQPGDLLHLDFGITYLRLNTDQQQHAYVLKPGETDAPESLKKALANGNRLQDIFTDLFEVGKTGNAILSEARAKAISEGINPSIYTHPLGYHGHAAGTTLGMWDSQGGVPIQGDYPLHANTAYSIELNAATFIPEWNKDIRIMLEENAFFDGEEVVYMDGRQTELYLIPSE